MTDPIMEGLCALDASVDRVLAERDAAIARADAAEARGAALREALANVCAGRVASRAATWWEAAALMRAAGLSTDTVTVEEATDRLAERARHVECEPEYSHPMLADPSPQVRVLLAARKVAEALVYRRAASPWHQNEEHLQQALRDGAIVALENARDDYEAAVKAAKEAP